MDPRPRHLDDPALRGTDHCGWLYPTGEYRGTLSSTDSSVTAIVGIALFLTHNYFKPSSFSAAATRSGFALPGRRVNFNERRSRWASTAFNDTPAAAQRTMAKYNKSAASDAT